MSDSRPTTGKLRDLSAGRRRAADALIPLIYDELRDLAAQHLRAERQGHTLQPTALINEVYLRMVDADGVEWRGRAQFLALAAAQIRRILVDHARRRVAAKRGGGVYQITLNEKALLPRRIEVDLLGLHDALSRLAARSERQSRVVELRFFGGLTVEESAEVLGVSTSTIKDDWAVARAWIRRELLGSGDE